MNYFTGELYHHGIKGQKWGIRRYQNLDGTLTPAGRERYGEHIEDVNNGKLKRQYLRSQFASIRKNGEQFKMDANFDKDRKKFIKDHKQVKDFEKYKTAAKEFAYNFNQKYASAALKDMGYADSQRARDYLLSQDWFGGVSWRELYPDK